jgi:hypothetical protein
MKKNNIQFAYILSFLSELYFPIVAWLFFYLRYFDFKQIAILTAVHVITSNLFEIPTGAFADLFGRKKAIFLAFFICSFVMISYPFTNNFWVFLVLEIIGGITNALLSGSLEALVYDTLKAAGEESRFSKVIANMSSLSWIGLFCSALLGGQLYQRWFGLPWVFQGIFFALAAGIALKLSEPDIDTRKYRLINMFTQNILGFKELFRNKKISQTTTVFIIIGSGYFIAGKILGVSQSREYGMNPESTGILFAIGYIITAIASQAFPKLKSWLGAKTLLLSVVTVLIVSFIFAKFVGLALGYLLIISRISTSTIFGNISSGILNPLLESKNRATSLSTFALMTQLPYVLLSYTIGGFLDKSSPNQFSFILGLSIIVLLVIQQLAFYIL